MATIWRVCAHACPSGGQEVDGGCCAALALGTRKQLPGARSFTWRGASPRNVDSLTPGLQRRQQCPWMSRVDLLDGVRQKSGVMADAPAPAWVQRGEPEGLCAVGTRPRRETGWERTENSYQLPFRSAVHLSVSFTLFHPLLPCHVPLFKSGELTDCSVAPISAQRCHTT